MCTVSINVNEATLREMRPDLDTTAAIRLWAQQQIELRIQQMRAEQERNASSRERALERDMTPEELYAVISEEIDDIYANG
jgi:hypothetical protein